MRPFEPISIHLIRHYPYVESEETREYDSLVRLENSWARLKHEEIRRMGELESKVTHVRDFPSLPEKIRNSVDSVLSAAPIKRTLLCYDGNGSKREIDTAHDLIRTFAIPDENIQEIELPKVRWQDDFWFIQRFNWKVRSILYSTHLGNPEIREIAIIGRRSHAYAFQYAQGRHLSVKETRSRLENNGVLSMVIDQLPKTKDAYGFLKDEMRIAPSRLQAKSILEKWELVINGETVFSTRHPIVVGDSMRFRNSNYRVVPKTIGDFVTTEILKYVDGA